MKKLITTRYELLNLIQLLEKIKFKGPNVRWREIIYKNKIKLDKLVSDPLNNLFTLDINLLESQFYNSEEIKEMFIKDENGEIKVFEDNGNKVNKIDASKLDLFSAKRKQYVEDNKEIYKAYETQLKEKDEWLNKKITINLYTADFTDIPSIDSIEDTINYNEDMILNYLAKFFVDDAVELCEDDGKVAD